MALSKRIAAGACAAALTLSLAACANTRYIAKVGDEDIKAGVYIYAMYNQFTNDIYTGTVTGETYDDILNFEMEDGKKYSDYLKDESLDVVKEYAAIYDQFEKLGLELTDEELSSINSSVKSEWESFQELYELEGISKESVKYALTAQAMVDKVFDYYYEEGGPDYFSNEELADYINENYVRFKIISVNKSTDEDEAAASEENEKNKERLERYLEMSAGVSFADFDSILDAYNEELNAEAEAEAAAAEESVMDFAEADSAAESLADTESEVNAPEDESSEDGSTESETEVSEDADSAADADNADSEGDQILLTDESGEDIVIDADDVTADEAETDPYASEYMVDVTGIEEDSTKELVDYMKSIEQDKAVFYEDDEFYYLIITGDVSERAAEYAEENRTSLVSTIKGDEFQAKVDSWVEALDLKINDAAIKRYTPKELASRINKYYDMGNN